jgi:hydroxyethylthiazole kinase-like sugar kinase family protein
MNRFSNVIELALEMIDELMQPFIHDFVDIQKLKFRTHAPKQLLGSVVKVALIPSRDLQK